MIVINPKIKGHICANAHPVGCAKNVKEQIDHVLKNGSLVSGPKKVLVIGASTGYGLATRIVAAFGANAATIGVFFERPCERKRTASAGWYNSATFETEARGRGIYAKSVNGDAFSDEVKRQVVDLIRKDLGQVDLVVYSLAAPRRIHPKTGETLQSCIKPVGGSCTNKSFDFSKNKVIQITLDQATPEEVRQTVGVMGGEDWEMWIDLLRSENLLAQGCLAMAYSYIGPAITQSIYRQGTIGAAKDHLEKTAHTLDKKMREIGGRALVSVNKALVTQASSAIPFISLYIILLMKISREKGLQEGCIEQIVRLFRDCIYRPGLTDFPVDAEGRIRMDDWEMRADVQEEVEKIWTVVRTAHARSCKTIIEYNQEFLKLFGFGLDGVDYNADVNVDVKIDSIA